MKSEIKWKDNLKSIGTNIPRVVPNEIYMAMSSIEFYTKTIRALERVGWSYSGRDGMIWGIHNERAIQINIVEQYNDHMYLVKFWKDDSVHLYLRNEYLKNRYGRRFLI